ncbi:uncharacterized protein LOC124293642 [Neodiprion lecontei]|uniref:Uncharacterized protein LOC124293642 n=1 Tax=Neodiprion lecontei TaxID=441921 RepID=A0ABM3FT86_NEOLC|nr:uncharacterized protein LOC124293642 [Neodiprion lecontei]
MRFNGDCPLSSKLRSAILENDGKWMKCAEVFNADYRKDKRYNAKGWWGSEVDGEKDEDDEENKVDEEDEDLWTTRNTHFIFPADSRVKRLTPFDGQSSTKDVFSR